MSAPFPPPSLTPFCNINCARSCDREIVALSVNYCPKRVALVRKFVKGKERGGAAWIGLSDLSMYELRSISVSTAGGGNDGHGLGDAMNL